MSNQWMIYGANGYTGELVAREAAGRGLKPILAGRRKEAIESIASELGLESVIFALDDREAATAALKDVAAVLHCAGPFVKTSKPMVAACLETGTHYLDITGEIAVFEACQRKSEKAVSAGCVLIPGVGFDVVPSDCLAAQLSKALPGAETLELAFSAGAGPSRGTAKTALMGIGQGGAVRKDGRIKKVPLAWKSKEVEFADKPRMAATIPWGDVSTSFYSTGIRDIEVYMAMPPKQIRAMKWSRPFLKILATAPAQRFLAKRIDARVKGPSATERQERSSQLWGRVTKGGDVVEATLTTPEAYKLTVLTALEAVQKVAAGGVSAGTKTPSQAFGADFIEQFDGTKLKLKALSQS